MKWLLFLALLINALFFMAQGNRQGADNTTVAEKNTSARLSIPSLRLLSEQASPTDAAAKSQRCVLIGPFTEHQALEVTKGKLAAEGFQSSKIPTSQRQNAHFWTYIKAQTAPASLIAMLDNLRKAQIDSYLLMYGEYLGAVSIKYFSNSAAAAEFVKDLAGLGVVAEVIDLKAQKINLWLKLTLESDHILPSWVNVAYPDKKTLKDNCDKVANGAQFH